MTRNGIFLIILAVLGGCAHKGFNRGALQDQIGVQNSVYSDKDIKEEFKKKSNLPKPFTLAVYFKKPRPVQQEQANWRWSEDDKKILEDAAAEFKNEKIVSDIFPLVDSVVGDEDLKSLRLVAAKHHADALLIITGTGETDRYLNGWGWTYLLLLPTLFVPGSEADTLFMTNATLWDVRNEYLYLTAETEAEVKYTYAAAFGKPEKQLLDEAKSKSLTSLNAEIKKMVKGSKL